MTAAPSKQHIMLRLLNTFQKGGGELSDEASKNCTHCTSLHVDVDKCLTVCLSVCGVCVLLHVCACVDMLVCMKGLLVALAPANQFRTVC